ncbi:hypothetical protein D3C72_1361830 [compost metagenome]
MFLEQVSHSLQQAGGLNECGALAQRLAEGLAILKEVTTSLQQQVAEDADLGLSNATAYLDLFGRVLVGWVWLRQALIAERALLDGAAELESDFYRGKLHTAKYYMEWELVQLQGIAQLLCAGNSACHDMQNRWF